MLGLNKDGDIKRGANTAFMKNSAFNEMFYHAHKRIDFTKKLSFTKGKNDLSCKLHSFYSMLTGRKFVTETGLNLYFQQKYFEKFFINYLLNAFYSAFSILFGVAHYEFSYGSSEDIYVIYLYSCSFFSVFLIINLILNEKMTNEFEIIDKTLNEDQDSLLDSNSRIIKLTLQIIFILIHPNVFCNGLTYQSYNSIVKMSVTRQVNDVLMIMLIMRVYWIITFLIHCSKYMESRMNTICRTYYFKTNLIFSLKSLIKTKPLATMTTAFFFFIFTFAFVIRIFERGISAYTDDDYNVFFNSIWFVTVTMTTVGFGDFTVRTIEGRSICIVACITGVFLFSLLIIVISNFLQMNSIELNMFIISEKCKINDEVNQNAKDVILEYFHFLDKKKMFLFQKNPQDDIRKDDAMIITGKENKVTIGQSDKPSKSLYDDHKLSTSSSGSRINSSRKLLLRNSRKLKKKLLTFESTYNMTQNFSCENIAFNILYNKFNVIFNELNESLKKYKLQNDKLIYIKDQLKEISEFLENEINEEN